MITPFRVLLLADEQGAKSLRRELCRGDCALHFSRAATSEQLHLALAIPIWDAVIYNPGDLPFDAHAALSFVARADRPLPFVLMTGKNGPEFGPTGAVLEDGAGDRSSASDVLKLGAFVREICREAKTDAQLPIDEAKLHVPKETIDAISQGILIANSVAPDYTIRFVNRAFVRMTGLPVDELLHKGLRVLHASRAGSFPCEEVYSALGELRPTRVNWAHVNKDGIASCLSLAIRPLWDEGTRLMHFMLVVTEQSEDNGLEESLPNESRLDGAGRFDQDFKELLSTIRTFSEVLQRELLPDSPSQEDLIRINEARERIERLTRRLLSMGDNVPGKED